MNSFARVSVFVLAVAAAFFGGRLYQHHQLLSGARFVTAQPLKLYSNVDTPPGVLPQGVTLYEFGGPDELPHFLLIVGTRELSSLRLDTSHDAFSRIPAEAAID